MEDSLYPLNVHRHCNPNIGLSFTALIFNGCYANVADRQHHAKNSTEKFVNEEENKLKLQCCPSQTNRLLALSLWGTYESINHHGILMKCALNYSYLVPST